MIRKRLGTIALALTVAGLLMSRLATGPAEAARMEPLSDSQLDAVYAEGVSIDLQFDVAISEGAQVVSNVGMDQLQSLLDNGFEVKATAGTGSTVTTGMLLDPAGASACLNPADVSLAGTSMGGLSDMGGIDISVVNGNVAIGINLAVFVNSTITNSSIYQFNFNFINPVVAVGGL